MEERRKSPRYKCMFPAKLLRSEGKFKLIERLTIHDLSREGLKLKINFVSLKPGSSMELELYFPEKGESTPLKAEIAWIKGGENSMEVGLKIKKMGEEAKNEILSWLAPSGSEKKNKKK
jgi:hypothetical protein